MLRYVISRDQPIACLCRCAIVGRVGLGTHASRYQRGQSPNYRLAYPFFRSALTRSSLEPACGKREIGTARRRASAFVVVPERDHVIQRRERLLLDCARRVSTQNVQQVARARCNDLCRRPRLPCVAKSSPTRGPRPAASPRSCTPRGRRLEARRSDHPTRRKGRRRYHRIDRRFIVPICSLLGAWWPWVGGLCEGHCRVGRTAHAETCRGGRRGSLRSCCRRRCGWEADVSVPVSSV